MKNSYDHGDIKKTKCSEKIVFSKVDEMVVHKIGVDEMGSKSSKNIKPF